MCKRRKQYYFHGVFRFRDVDVNKSNNTSTYTYIIHIYTLLLEFRNERLVSYKESVKSVRIFTVDKMNKPQAFEVYSWPVI